jgi:hypothetical protein
VGKQAIVKEKMTWRDWTLLVVVITGIIGLVWLYLQIANWAQWLVVSTTLGGLIVIGRHDLVTQWRKLWPLQMQLWLIALSLIFGTLAVSRLGLHWQLSRLSGFDLAISCELPSLMVIGLLVLEKDEMALFSGMAPLWVVLWMLVSPWSQPQNIWGYWVVVYGLIFGVLWLAKRPGGIWLSLLLMNGWLVGMML